MLTARRAFDGENTALVMAAILTAEPAVVPESVVPKALARVLGRCLAKDPEERWQTARHQGPEDHSEAAEAGGDLVPAVLAIVRKLGFDGFMNPIRTTCAA